MFTANELEKDWELEQQDKARQERAIQEVLGTAAEPPTRLW